MKRTHSIPARMALTAVAAALSSVLGTAHAQTVAPLPEPGPSGNSAPTIVDAAAVAAVVPAGMSVVVPLPAVESRADDADGDALGWALQDAPDESRVETDGGVASLGGDGTSVLFSATVGFEGTVDVALVARENATAERLASADAVTVSITVTADDTVVATNDADVEDDADVPEPDVEQEFDAGPESDVEPGSEMVPPPAPDGSHRSRGRFRRGADR